MIGLDEVRRKAGQWGVEPEVVERDYVLNWVLAGLFNREKLAQTFIFKGGTALRKLYFPGYRFSEDLDFTAANGISGGELREEIGAACKLTAKESGLDFNLVSFRRTRDREEGKAFEARIEYLGPIRRRGSLPRVKLDITSYEIVVLPSNHLSLSHPYSDECSAIVPVYPLEEITAEKLRTLLTRPWARHVYDLWQLLGKREIATEPQRITSTFRLKCEYKGLAFTGVDDLIEPLSSRALERSWQASLARQVRDLPADFNVVRRELVSLLRELFVEEARR